MIWLVVLSCIVGNCEATSVKSYSAVENCKGDLIALKFVREVLPPEVTAFSATCTDKPLMFWPPEQDDLGNTRPRVQI